MARIVITDRGHQAWLSQNNSALDQAVRHARLPLCITDPNLPDNPIIFANKAFLELTGYKLDDVLGRNCRFLQGPDTTPESVNQVRRIIAGQSVDTVEIINYRRDGSRFVNALQIGPIMDDTGKVVMVFGSQLDVTEKHAQEQQARDLANRELVHRLRNIVNVMTVLIRLTARDEDNIDAFSEKVIGRLTALGTAHFDTIVRPRDDTPTLSQLARSIVTAYAPLGPVQFTFDGGEDRLPAGLISPVTLCLHELATNAVKHGALSTPMGHVVLSTRMTNQIGPNLFECTWTETGGPRVAVPERSSGSKIIQTLVAGAGGKLDLDWQPDGLVATATFQLLG